MTDQSGHIPGLPTDDQLAMIALIERVVPAERSIIAIALCLLEQHGHAGVTLEVDWPVFLGLGREEFRGMLAWERWKYEERRRMEEEFRCRSERIKAGLARRKAEGLPIGRKQGAVDSKRRRRSGYIAAWEEGGARRRPRTPPAAQ